MSTEPMRRTRRGPQESSAARRSRSAGEAPWSSAPAPAAVQAPPAPLAWGSPAEYLRMAMGRSPIVFLLGALLFVESPMPGIAMNLPVSETVMGVLLAGSLLRSGRLRAAAVPVVMVLLAAAYVWLLAVSITSDVEWTRRMVRIGMLFGFALMLATGRVPLRPLIFGMGVGLVINAVLFFAGLAPDNYQGALSGYILDKNVAGFVYAVVPLLVVAFIRHPWARVLILLLGLVLVFETGSRTGLAAMILGTAWMALGGRGGPVLRAAVLTAFYFVFIWAEENLASLDVFGDRTGTDWFRGRIDDAAWAKTQQAMPWGEGAGQAFVLLPPEQQPFFFHNSYWALIVEGGLPLLVLMLAALAIGGFGLGAAGRRTWATTAAQASVLVILLVSFRLGEVFLTVYSMVALGGAMALWELERRRMAQERAHARSTGASAE